jgi:hypothetical protein
MNSIEPLDDHIELFRQELEFRDGHTKGICELHFIALIAKTKSIFKFFSDAVSVNILNDYVSGYMHAIAGAIYDSGHYKIFNKILYRVKYTVSNDQPAFCIEISIPIHNGTVWGIVTCLSIQFEKQYGWPPFLINTSNNKIDLDSIAYTFFVESLIDTFRYGTSTILEPYKGEAKVCVTSNTEIASIDVCYFMPDRRESKNCIRISGEYNLTLLRDLNILINDNSYVNITD